MKLSRAAVGTTIGVAVISCLLAGLWVSAMISRGRTYSEQARSHAEREVIERRNVEEFASPKPLKVGGIGELEVGSELRANWEKASRLRLAYHAELKKKYEKAAKCPWIGVDPDPDDPGTELMMPPSAKYMTDDVKYFATPIDASVRQAVDRTP